MRSTATSAATSRCAWPRRPAASRASWRGAIVAALPASPLLRTRRSGGRRIHQSVPGARRARRGAAAVLEQGARYGTSNVGSGTTVLRRIRVRQSHRAAARRPRPPGRLRGDARQPARRHRARRAARVLHQRCRPAGRHPHRERVGALPAGAAASRAVPGQRLSRRLRERDRRSAARARTARRCGPSAASVHGGPASRCARRRQGAVHRRADRAHARAARRGRYQAVQELGAGDDARGHPRGPCGLRGATSTAGTSERALARSGAVERTLAAPRSTAAHL